MEAKHHIWWLLVTTIVLALSGKDAPADMPDVREYVLREAAHLDSTTTFVSREIHVRNARWVEIYIENASDASELDSLDADTTAVGVSYDKLNWIALRAGAVNTTRYRASITDVPNNNPFRKSAGGRVCWLIPSGLSAISPYPGQLACVWLRMRARPLQGRPDSPTGPQRAGIPGFAVIAVVHY